MLKFLCFFFVTISFTLSAQEQMVPSDHILTNNELVELLDVDADSGLKKIQAAYHAGKQEKALQMLTEYFKNKLSDRYFFSSKNFNQRFEEYNKMYSGRFEYHQKKAKQHLELYPAWTNWKIPFTNLKGEKVSSYPYRHLTRQHKAGDIALLFYFTKDTDYLHYIPKQAESLNEAFNKGEVETIVDGNGAYEAYRAGNRMYNWLFVHQCLLASDQYTWQEQLVMIKTFLHTGAKLYHHNPKYNEGNHQTRGMSALGMLGILFKEIKGTDEWWTRATNRLEEHLEKEVYKDGFQFERSVHYHVDDIDNYFYPYQLAKMNGVSLNPIWDQRLKGMFDAMLQLAMPNKNLPVLQDDTKDPWAEVNKVEDIMALGAALFGDKKLKYFTGKKIPSKYYWLLSTDQVEKYKTAKASKPKMSSTDLPHTGYYVMRNGWKKENLYMVISAGLTEEKPDHQHGDMLGIQAFAYGNMVLPNYQVRYYLDDLEEFKNSWTKNVGLVDSVLHGREWKGNKGGSGFGKWGKLPTPKLINWTTTDEIDIFIGSHDGYKDLNVDTYRQVFFIKDGFWIVRDHYKSKDEKHTYQQVWQGHYDAENDIHVRSVFPNGAGLEIIQLGHRPDFIRKKSIRGKGRIIFEAENEMNTTFTSLLYPFKDFENRIHANSQYDDLKLAGWNMVSKEDGQVIESNSAIGISKKGITLLFDCSKLKIKNAEILMSNPSDLLIKKKGEEWEIANCGILELKLTLSGHVVDLKPGKSVQIEL
ncbi:heparinase II/III family protein [Labilibaculum sp. DW002]|uniref:Heparinase II/III family protein n=1 Tax=Paralabilibaculum antarcticum TaxID=2912572 RepID=A0ABT5VTQ1_9BACT|nr:heparinase II/III family protein [Labilibaculum sp. DW002]MDE5418806.1 heparinase II/III family protein [Labilibaculum sp. DW002]